jgi:threonine/homoserine/homoserine lactone efflux protein
MPNLSLFILAVASILASPGPTNALLTTSAALVGIRRSLPLMSAEIAGYFVTIAILLGISRPLINASPIFGLALRAALIVYLVWLAWRLWRSDNADESAKGAAVTWRRVFITTLLNPKGPIFAFGVFPTLDGAKSVVIHFGAFALTTLVVAAGWMTFGASIGRLANRDGRHIPLSRITSVVLVLFACLVAASIFARRNG